jgi:flagellar basal body-associated protein FliL
MIDTIDTHVENANQYVEQGGKEISKAIVYRQQSRKRMWWILLLVIVLLAIVAIIIYTQRCKLLNVDCTAPVAANTTQKMALESTTVSNAQPLATTSVSTSSWTPSKWMNN